MAKLPEGLMTQSAFARRRGVTRQVVGEWKDRGLLVMTDHPGRKHPVVLVDETEANLETLQNPIKTEPHHSPVSAAPATPAPQPEQEPVSITRRARDQRELADAATARLKYESAAGNLVPRAELTDIAAAAAALQHQTWERLVETAMGEALAASDLREMRVVFRRFKQSFFTSCADSLVEFDRLSQPPNPDYAFAAE